MKFKNYLHKINESTMSMETVANGIQSAWKSVFPHSSSSVSKGSLGGNSLHVKCFFAKDKSEFANGISQNDPLALSFHIDGFDKEGNTTDNMTIEFSQRSITTAPEDKYMAFGSSKIPVKKTSGNIGKIESYLKSVFMKVKEQAKQLHSGDKLHSSHKDFIHSKIKE